jgi:hypothetical protein
MTPSEKRKKKLVTEIFKSSLTVCWVKQGIGFGRFGFYKNDDGSWHIENECMGKDFIKEVLCDLVDNATLRDGGPDPCRKCSLPMTNPPLCKCLRKEQSPMPTPIKTPR